MSSLFAYVVGIVGAGSVIVVTATNLAILSRVPSGNPAAPAGCECSIPTTDIRNAKIVNGVFLGIGILIIITLLYRIFRPAPRTVVIGPGGTTRGQDAALVDASFADAL